LIAAGDPLARAYLASILARPDKHRTTHAATFEELMRALAPGHAFDLAIIDWDLPGMAGDSGLKKVRNSLSSGKVVVLTSMNEEEAEVLSQRLHSATVLSKHLSAHKLVRAIKETLAADKSDATVQEPPHREFLGHELTARQRSVLDLIVGGLTNRQIAKVLGISEGTVKAHINSAYKIMGVHNRVTAAATYSRVTSLYGSADEIPSAEARVH